MFVGVSYYPATHFLNLPIMILTASTQALASTRNHKYQKPLHSRVPLNKHGNRYHERRLRRFYKLRCVSSFLLRKAPLVSMKGRVRRGGKRVEKGPNEGRGLV